MKIWLPYITAGSGTDVFTRELAEALEKQGVSAVCKAYPHKWQYFPWRLSRIKPPKGTNVILTNSWNGFAFKRPGIKLLTVEHLCVHDPMFSPYRSIYQGVFHNTFIRYFEKTSFKSADAVIAVSNYTAKAVQRAFSGINPHTIQNGVDVHYFKPKRNKQHEQKNASTTLKLLFVGNLTRRKGADLLPQIMKKLGENYHLYYTGEVKTKHHSFDEANMTSIGSLNREQVLRHYQQADIVLFPTRLEGLPLTALEAMASGTPVVASHCSSLPELIEDNVNGKLCPVDNVDAFVSSIRALSEDRKKLIDMGQKASELINLHFSLEEMGKKYIRLFENILDKNENTAA